jgi:protocatechuate 3,4-dioxygenase beta subunit
MKATTNILPDGTIPPTGLVINTVTDPAGEVLPEVTITNEGGKLDVYRSRLQVAGNIQFHMIGKASDYQKEFKIGAGQVQPGVVLQPTPPDILGPFYLPNAPIRHTLYAKGSLVIHGRVLDTDGKVLDGALVEVWQADANGDYDNNPLSMGFRGNQVVGTGSFPAGEYFVQTILPGDYKISDPGQPDDFRCSHIHFKISVKGCKPLVTQLYFPNDKYNATDHWFDARRVITPPNATFDFVLEKA